MGTLVSVGNRRVHYPDRNEYRLWVTVIDMEVDRLKPWVDYVYRQPNGMYRCRFSRGAVHFTESEKSKWLVVGLKHADVFVRNWTKAAWA